MTTPQQDTAQQFVQRRNKNLEYFRIRFPALYNHFKGLQMKRVEVVVSPKEKDVDLIVDGASWYGGKAREKSRQEARDIMTSYQEGMKLRTYAPPWEDAISNPRFASRAVKRALACSTLTREEFEGYVLSNFLPSVVFLGSGLGYQVEALTEKVEIIDAVVFEPDDEVFAASLFTVEWDVICKRFSDRKGSSIRFAIGLNSDEPELKDLLKNTLYKSTPLYPVATIYFNHRSQGRMQRLAELVAKDLPTYLIGWGGYDDELRRLNNTVHNVELGRPYMAPGAMNDEMVPVVIVGSGPSIDDRIEDIRRVRDRVIVVSAGTGIQGLMKSGMRPDFHVELDPDYTVYQRLSALDQDSLRQVRLLAINEINPLVSQLFNQALLYFKKDNPLPRLLGAEDQAFSFCNPTCTNAALAVFSGMGFRQVYLFGCDFGFRSHDRHHASTSIYGDDEDSETAQRLKKRAASRFRTNSTFEIKGVDGGTVHTLGDFYTAKRQVEAAIQHAGKSGRPLQVMNCSDGAVIEGATWQDSWTFCTEVEALSLERADVEAAVAAFGSHTRQVNPGDIDVQLRGVFQQLRQRTRELAAACDSLRLEGKKDVNRMTVLLAATNDRVVVKDKHTIASGSQIEAQHLIGGTVRRILLGLFSHAMAYEDQLALKTFLQAWKKEFKEFLEAIPEHFHGAVCERLPLDEDPWVKQSKDDAEDAIVEETGATR